MPHAFDGVYGIVQSQFTNYKEVFQFTQVGDLALVCAFAFHPAAKVQQGGVNYFWYSLTGTDKNNAADYTEVGSEPSCASGANVCGVLAQDDGTGHPLGIPSSGCVTTNQFIQQVDHKR